MSASAAVHAAVLPVAPATPAVAGTRVDVVSDYEALVALEPTWNRLCDTAGVEHPFLTHEWVCSWWEAFGAGKALHVVVVRSGGEVIGIAPLMLSRVRVWGLRLRRLELIGNVHTQRSDFIVGAAKESAYAALWAYLARERASWDVLMLPQIPAGSPTLDHIPALAAGDGFAWYVWRGGDSPVVRLTGTWESYVAKLARKHRSNLRNRWKRLQQVGPVELEVIQSGPELSAALEEGLRLEAAAWKGRAGTAIGCRADLTLFYGRMAVRAARQGWLRLQFLTVGRQRVAFAFTLCYGRTLYLLKPGYDPTFAAYSPSNLLLYLVLRQAFEEQILAHDLLGANDAWKQDWTDETTSHFWLFVFGTGPRARLFRLAKCRLVPAVKNLSRVLRKARSSSTA